MLLYSPFQSSLIIIFRRKNYRNFRNLVWNWCAIRQDTPGRPSWRLFLSKYLSRFCYHYATWRRTLADNPAIRQLLRRPLFGQEARHLITCQISETFQKKYYFKIIGGALAAFRKSKCAGMSPENICSRSRHNPSMK